MNSNLTKQEQINGQKLNSIENSTLSFDKVDDTDHDNLRRTDIRGTVCMTLDQCKHFQYNILWYSEKFNEI